MSVPITLLTGFLGSGKTTLCNRLVRQPSMRDALVLINEAGEVSIDHHLVEEIDERTVVLPSGCVCCALRDDLVQVLSSPELVRGRTHIFVETSGLADPTPLVATILRHPQLEGYHLREVMVALDPERATTLLDRHPEAIKQLALADTVVITKCDLASEDQIRHAESLARSLAPEAEVRRAARGEFARDAEARPSRHTKPPEEGAHVHTHGIRTFTVESTSRAPFEKLALWLSMMSQLHGDRLIRFKGLVHVEDHDDPVVVQSVNHIVYPTHTLPRWPDEQPRTQLVGITHGMSEQLYADALETLRDVVRAEPI